MKNILMIVHTFPPHGSVGGSIRIIKFLKYITQLRDNIFCTIITLTDECILLNDPHLSKSSIVEIPKKNMNIIRTNTLQPRHPYANQLNNKGNDFIRNDRINFKSKLRLVIKKIYFIIEKYILIPDYSILWAPYLIREAIKQSKNTDIIYATAPPFSILIQAVLISKIIHKKLIIDIKDDWTTRPAFKLKPILIRKFEQWMERFCIKNADRIILVTQSSFDDFNKRYTKYKDKFSLITNGCDVSEYVNYWQIDFSPNLKFKIIHSGVISNSRDPSGFFQALSELKNENIINNYNFEVKFIGSLPKNILSMVFKYGIKDIVTCIDPLEREDYIKAICKAELLLAFNYQIKTLIPGKLYDYWGSRRPILLIDSNDSSAAQLIFENKLGDVRDFSDVRGIKEVINHYLKLWKDDDISNKTNIENLYKYDRKNLTKKLIEIFDNI